MYSTQFEQVRNSIRHNLAFDDQINAKDSRIHGKELRKKSPRSAHAKWNPPEDRLSPIALLLSQAKSRVPELIPIRYERMAESPFAFYRGSALLMANDLAGTPNSGIRVQACGDAHISNFGLFQSPERRLVFDINDFDETTRGPWEWDVKRLVTSVEICGRQQGFTKEQRKAATTATAAAYHNAMNNFAEMGTLDVWYAHADIDSLSNKINDQESKNYRRAVDKVVDKARKKNSARAVSKFTEIEEGKLRIVSQPPLIVPMRELLKNSTDPLIIKCGESKYEEFIALVLAEYRKSLSHDKQHLVKQYRAVDIARKVVGVGSVGTRAWIVVLEGSGPDDMLVLQIKEAQRSVLERYVGKSPFLQHGQRVVEGQRAMQTASDIFLGWTRSVGLDGKVHDFYVRQLWDGKGSFDLSSIDAEGLTTLGKLCGWTLAHAHARTGNRFALAGYLGNSDTFDRAIVSFANEYANQNEQDFNEFMEAYRDGTLNQTTGMQPLKLF